MGYKINPPVWQYPNSASGKIIIVIDRQKPWESVADYRDRVVDLFHSHKMSEQHDQHFMSRIFLGGLRPQILDALLQNEKYFSFKSVTFHAEVLELLHLPKDVVTEEPAEKFSFVKIGKVVCVTTAASEGQGLAMGVPSAAANAGHAAIALAGPAGTRNGAGGAQRGWVPPTYIQDGKKFYGESNAKIDELYNAEYVLVLYR